MKKSETDTDPYHILGHTYAMDRRFFRAKDGGLIILLSCVSYKLDTKGEEPEVRFTLRREPVGTSTVPSISYGNVVPLSKFAPMVEKEIDIYGDEEFASYSEEDRKKIINGEPLEELPEVEGEEGEAEPGTEPAEDAEEPAEAAEDAVEADEASEEDGAEEEPVAEEAQEEESEQAETAEDAQDESAEQAEEEAVEEPKDQ